MTERFSEFAKGQMGAIEELIKGLPGVKGYVDKELRRDADKRVRMMIAAELEQDKQQLFDLQKKLLKRGGLQETRTAHAQRVPQGDGSTVRIDARIIVRNAQTARAAQCLCSKGFVQFDDVHLGQFQPSTLQGQLRGAHRTDAHDAWLHAGHRAAYDAGQRL